jgi:hypothetical protein
MCLWGGGVRTGPAVTALSLVTAYMLVTSWHVVEIRRPCRVEEVAGNDGRRKRKRKLVFRWT